MAEPILSPVVVCEGPGLALDQVLERKFTHLHFRDIKQILDKFRQLHAQKCQLSTPNNRTSLCSSDDAYHSPLQNEMKLKRVSVRNAVDRNGSDESGGRI